MLLTMTLNGVFQFMMTSKFLAFLLNKIVSFCLLFNLVFIDGLCTDRFEEIKLCTYHSVLSSAMMHQITSTQKKILLARSVIGFVLFQLQFYLVLLQCT
jgi:hypothetical protein